MTDFFPLITEQMAEVGRTRQRCARRIRRFVAAGTLEQSRGIARQLNDALATANELLQASLADRRLGYEIPLATPTSPPSAGSHSDPRPGTTTARTAGRHRR